MTAVGHASVLEIEGLTTVVHNHGGINRAVDDVSFDIKRSEIVGLVGESGSGKTLTGLSIARLLPDNVRVTAGRIYFNDVDVLELPERAMRRYRGRKIGSIFQDPMTSLNPVLTVGDQIDEGAMLHLGLSRRAARSRTVEFLERVGVADAAHRANAYPHEFSGGMRQRVMIAIALICEPDLVIADEPTTSLDVTVQAQVLETLADLANELQTAILFITHDMGIAAKMCDRVNVMYAGRVVEQSATSALFTRPEMPYTWALLQSVPTFDLVPGATLPSIGGMPATNWERLEGCRFAPRCSYVRSVCEQTEPPLAERGHGHFARCHGTAQGGWIRG